MPIYEYACEKCESEFDVEQRITDGPIKSCPRCKSRKLKRLISRTSFVLKGGGWYSDLYSSPKGDDKSAEKVDSSKAQSSDGAADSKSDSKSKAKTGEKSKDKSPTQGQSTGKSSKA